MSYARMNSAINQYQAVGAAGAAFADPHRLIQMLLEGAISRINAALGALSQQDIPTKAQQISKASAIIDGLRDGLDMEKGGELAANLDGLYEYMQVRLVSANARNDSALLQEVAQLLHGIKEAWDAIPPEQRSPASSPG